MNKESKRPTIIWTPDGCRNKATGEKYFVT